MGRKLILAGAFMLLGTLGLAIAHYAVGLPIDGDVMASVPERHRAAYLLLMFAGGGIFLLVGGVIVRSLVGAPEQHTGESSEPKKPSYFGRADRLMSWWRSTVLCLAGVLLIFAMIDAL